MLGALTRSHALAALLAVGVVHLLPALAGAQTLQPPVLINPDGTVPTPPPTTTSPAFPLSWNDGRFANVRTSGAIGTATGTISDVSITADGPSASVQGSNFTLTRSRVSSREAVRTFGSGTVTINDSWLEAAGQSGDHADTLQCYGGGTNNVINNTTFRAYSSNATAGYFAADGWTGNHTFNNVLFWGGPFGLRINCDGGRNLALNGVYFVKGSFGNAGYMVNNGKGSGCGGVTITQWTNVFSATIVNGQLVVGAALPPPCTVPCNPGQVSGG